MTQEEKQKALDAEFALVGRCALQIEECERLVKQAKQNIQAISQTPTSEKVEEIKTEAA